VTLSISAARTTGGRASARPSHSSDPLRSIRPHTVSDAILILRLFIGPVCRSPPQLDTTARTVLANVALLPRVGGPPTFMGGGGASEAPQGPGTTPGVTYALVLAPTRVKGFASPVGLRGSCRAPSPNRRSFDRQDACPSRCGSRKTARSVIAGFRHHSSHVLRHALRTNATYECSSRPHLGHFVSAERLPQDDNNRCRHDKLSVIGVGYLEGPMPRWGMPS